MKALSVIILTVAGSVSMHAASPYITEVYDYFPAPGQFVNVWPTYADGDNVDDMRRKVLDAIGGTNGGTASLGGFGGYVTFGFGHPVINVSGERDLRVLGNAFFSDRALKPDGGSCEPGIIMVSHDSNGNGLPDDEWYEIAGSAHSDAATIHEYSITYTRPAANHTPVVTDPKGAYDDEEYIAWTDNRGQSGYIGHLVINKNNYYPLWTDAQTLTFSGTRLPDNAVIEGSRVKEWVLYGFEYGYADNMPNDDPRSAIDLDWAVDANGNPANLESIHFVRVYTALNQQCGAIGETSTEVCGAVDLHPDAAGVTDIVGDGDVNVFYAGGEVRALGLNDGDPIDVYSIAGELVLHADADGPLTAIPFVAPAGIYIAHAGGKTHKIVISF